MSGAKRKDKYIFSTEWLGSNSFSGDNIKINVSSNKSEELSSSFMVRLDINQITCRFSVGCELNLNYIARYGSNVDYYQKPYLSLQLRIPLVTASLFHTGNVVVFGAKSVDEAKLASRRIARMIQKLNHRDVTFKNFRLTSIQGTIDFPFTLKHVEFAKNNKNTFYEPELNLGNSVEYRVNNPFKAKMSIYSTGKVVFKCSCISDLNELLHHIVSRVYTIRSRKKSKSKTNPLNNKVQVHVKHNEVSKMNIEMISGKRTSRKAICYCESDESPEKKSKSKNSEEDEKIVLSEYELLRERRIKERQKLLKDIDIEGAKKDALVAAKLS